MSPGLRPMRKKEEKRNMDRITESLGRHPVARELSPEDIAYLAGFFGLRRYEAGTYIYYENQPRRAFGIVLSGRITILKGRNGQPQVLTVLRPGEAFGVGSLLDDYPHATSARVDEPSEVAELPREAVERLADERPGTFARLAVGAAKLISGQLRAANELLVGREAIYVSGETRREKDLLGERDVPERSYYGIQTLRAVENFPITGIRIAQFPHLVNALAAVKQAAAEANLELGILDPEIARAIIEACREIMAGELHSEFVVDVIQGGAGTSTNMNANEVIANRALELLGRRRGDYAVVHPNNHVNLSQSTNDAVPTALRIAAIWALRDLEVALGELKQAFYDKAAEFAHIVKIGRTQLQDAVPMTLGQEFHAFATTIGEDIHRLRESAALIHEINLGATAIGTGINSDPRYPPIVRKHLSRITGLELVTSPDLVEATADTGAFVQLSGMLKRVAVKLSKICNDLRLLSSGPRAGLGEINLPPMQPGSSIMPGKVNPVIPEVVNQVCFQVVGNDLTVTMAAEGGQLQLNVFEPVIAFNIFQSIDILTRACIILRERAVVGITANPERIREHLERSIGVVTALVPYIGYDRATALAREAMDTGRGVVEILHEKDWLTPEQIDAILSPEAMTRPRFMPRSDSAPAC